MPKVSNLINQKFGSWTVIKSTNDRKNGQVMWLCICNCGRENLVRSSSLTSGASTSCGCSHKENLQGMRFGRLLVLFSLDKRKDGKVVWECECDCGKHCEIKSSSLLQGLTKSCGCLQKEKASKTGKIYGPINGRKNSLGYGVASFNELYAKYKYRATKRNLGFGLSKDQFKSITEKSCYYCKSSPNQELYSESFDGHYKYNGIDRIDNSKGYIIDNCVPCCGACNRAKYNKDIDEFRDWIKSLYNNFVLGEEQ